MHSNIHEIRHLFTIKRKKIYSRKQKNKQFYHYHRLINSVFKCTFGDFILSKLISQVGRSKRIFSLFLVIKNNYFMSHKLARVRNKLHALKMCQASNKTVA